MSTTAGGIILALFMFSTSCGSPSPTASQRTGEIPIQRFVPVDLEAGKFALDTRTGQLCRTVERTDYYLAFKLAEITPTCYSLYLRDR